MRKQVFISYSTRDKAAADAIAGALEAAGVPCWIAPRDLNAGAPWGGSIVEAIEACDAVLVAFSSASNDSPQVAREMELAVSRRKPLIPIRLENTLPTQDMQFFLGVSHWFDAYEGGLERHLTRIVEQVKAVLVGQSRPWQKLRRRLPGGRVPMWVWIPLLVLGLVILSRIIEPKDRIEEAKLPLTPLVGRWEARDIPGCRMEIQKLGYVTFTTACPPPLSGEKGNIMAADSPVWSEKHYGVGDGGTFTLLGGGSIHNYSGAYRIDGRELVMQTDQGQRRWRKD